MKTAHRRQTKESGQAVVMTVLGISIFLMGALGLAVDGSNLYAQRQLAQAAADAAAQAGMMDIFETTGQFTAVAGTTYTCSTATPTPCYYAMTLNGFNTGSDSVSYTPSTVSGGSFSPVFSPNQLQVTVKRNVPATVMRLLGFSTFPVTASAVAAIVYVDSPVPIIVTHPTLASSFNTGGTGSNPKIQICGGPPQSIQVNSTSGSALSASGSGVIDLSHAGPNDPGTCTTGTGGDFGVTGPSNTSPTLSLGSTGFYLDPSPAIQDPLASVNPPPDPTVLDSLDVNPPTGSVGAGVSGCPAGSGGCTVFFPGKYTTDIDVKTMVAVFAPGIYYMYGSNFKLDSNGNPFMLTGYTDSSTTGVPTISPTVNCCGTGTNWSENMLVYLTGPTSAGKDTTGTFYVDANAGKQQPTSFLIGAPNGSSYKGILLFVDRNAAANVCPPPSGCHSIDGGAHLQITGTLYMNSNFNTATVYQELHLGGSGGGTTKLTGEIITSTIDLQGTPDIVMNLNSTVAYKLNKVALVQ